MFNLKKEKLKKFSSRPGVTLMEVLVSVAIFTVLMLSATQIFQMVLVSQRRAIATQNLQESLKYFFEVVSKEVRMAQRNPASGPCSQILVGDMFSLGSNIHGQVLHLRNYREECVTYSLQEDEGIIRFQVSRDEDSAYLTPRKTEVKELQFIVVEEVNSQPRLTLNLLASAPLSGEEELEIRLQTSITSRYYRSAD